jgi:hypothetical protein
MEPELVCPVAFIMYDLLGWHKDLRWADFSIPNYKKPDSLSRFLRRAVLTKLLSKG